MGRIYTAHRIYPGPDRVDVSASGNDAIGAPFAPSWALREAALDLKLNDMTSTWGWAQFAARYRGELERARFSNPGAWQAFLERDVTLVCVCTRASRCHRVLLAARLAADGADYAGERETPYGASLHPVPPPDPATVSNDLVAADEMAFSEAMPWCVENRVRVSFDAEHGRVLTFSVPGLRLTMVVEGNSPEIWQRAFASLATRMRTRLQAHRSGVREKITEEEPISTRYSFVAPRGQKR